MTQTAKLVMLVLMAGISVDASASPLQRMEFLCSWMKTRMPRVGSAPELCDPARMQSASPGDLTEGINAYWAQFTGNYAESAASMRKLYEAAYLAKYPPPPKPPRQYSATELDAMDTGRLCAVWRARKLKPAMEEIRQRKAFVPSDLDLIAKKQVAIGMSVDAMQCSLGKAGSRNRTVNRHGDRIQWVYGDVLIYSENGIVTAWQD